MPDVPKLEETLTMGNLRKDTSPILSKKQAVPDAVAPPKGAAKSESNARGAMAMGQALGQAGNVLAKVALDKQDVMNRNDTAKANVAYAEEMDGLNRELTALQGFDARGVADTFKQKESAIRGRLLSGLNSNVRNRVAPMLDMKSIQGYSNISGHEKTELDGETIAMTQVTVNKRVTDMLTIPYEHRGKATESTISLIDSVGPEQLPGMSASQIENWQMAQKSLVHSSSIQDLFSDPYDETRLKAGTDYYASFADDLSREDRLRFAPMVNAQVFEFSVTENLARMGQRDFNSGIGYIEKNFSGKMEKRMKAEHVRHLNQEAAMKVARGVSLSENFMRNKWESIPATDPVGRLRAVEQYSLSLGTEDRLLFANHMGKYQRIATMDIAKMNSVALNMQYDLLSSPEGKDQFMTPKSVNAREDLVRDQFLTRANVNALEREHKKVWKGVNTATGKETTVKMNDDTPSFLTKYITELGLDPAEEGLLRQGLSTWVRTTGHSIAPEKQFTEGKAMIDLLTQDGMLEFTTENAQVFEDSMMFDEVLQGVSTPQSIVREVISGLKETSDRDGTPLTQGQIVTAALVAIEASPDIAPEHKKEITSKLLRNTVKTERERDMAKYRNDVGLPDDGGYPLAITFPTTEDQTFEAMTEVQRLDNIKSVYSLMGYDFGEVPKDGPDRKEMRGRLRDVGATEEDMKGMSPQRVAFMYTGRINELTAMGESLVQDFQSIYGKGPRGEETELADDVVEVYGTARDFWADVIPEIPSAIMYLHEQLKTLEVSGIDQQTGSS